MAMTLEDQLGTDLSEERLAKLKNRTSEGAGGFTGHGEQPAGTQIVDETPELETKPPTAPPETKPATNTLSREQWRDEWMSRGSMTPQEADEWLRTHGATEVSGTSGKWTTPHGETLDVQIGRSGALATGGRIMPGWTRTDGGGEGTGTNAPAGGGAGGAGGIGGAGGLGRDALSSMLAELITESRRPVDMNDPTMQNRLKPIQQSLQRGAERKRASAAERAYAEGIGTGGLDSDIAGILEEQAAGEAAAIGKLSGDELQAKRSQLMQTLSMNKDLLTEGERLALQRELAQLDAQLRREGYGIQRDQLGQQNQQFYDQFGADQGWRQYLADKDAALFMDE